MAQTFLVQWYTNNWNYATTNLCSYVRDCLTEDELFVGVPDEIEIHDWWLSCFLQTKRVEDYPHLHSHNASYPVDIYLSIVCEYEYYDGEQDEYMTNTNEVYRTPIIRVQADHHVADLQSFVFTHFYQWLIKEKRYMLDEAEISDELSQYGFAYLPNIYDDLCKMFFAPAIVPIET